MSKLSMLEERISGVKGSEGSLSDEQNEALQSVEDAREYMAGE